MGQAGQALAFFFEKNATFGNDNGYVAVNVALAIFVNQGDGDVCVSNALSQRNTKDARVLWWLCDEVSSCVTGVDCWGCQVCDDDDDDDDKQLRVFMVGLRRGLGEGAW